MLAPVSRVRNLGVPFSDDLKYDSYIQDIVSSAYRRANLILRGFHTRNLCVLSKLYTTYVRPHLEFSTYVWNPVTVSLINLIENVQRKFTKRTMLRKNIRSNFPGRWAFLRLETLELRRFYFDLVLTYKIIHKQISLTCIDYFDISPRGIFSRSKHPYKLLHGDARKSCSFACRVVKAWNDLPPTVASAQTSKVFLQRLQTLPVEELKFSSKIHL